MPILMLYKSGPNFQWDVVLVKVCYIANRNQVDEYCRIYDYNIVYGIIMLPTLRYAITIAKHNPIN